MIKQTISGILSSRIPYSEEFRNLILSRIPEVRKQFDLQHTQDVDHDNLLYKHSRYKDDSRVIHVLESNIEEKYFDKTRLDNYIFAVLEDAANADYYYSFEKDYGTDDIETDDDVD